MNDSLVARVAALKTSPTPDLKQMWREMFLTEPPPFNRRFLETRLAYRIQELVLGGLRRETASTPFVATISPPAAVEAVLKEQHLVFQENQRGVSFDALFGSYLAGAKRIIITDPYMRLFHQLRNLMDLMETISKFKGPDEEVAVHAVTVEDEFNGDRQSENLQKIADACQSVGIQFTWAYDTSGTKHDRDITTDHGWKIALSRVLDVFQRFELNDAFNFANRLQQHRQCKEFNVTYVRMSPGDAKS